MSKFGPSNIAEYYIYTIIVAVIITFIVLPLGNFAPLDEPKVYAYNGEIYNLGPVVGVSFSAFLSLMIFIISAIILWGSRNIFYNMLIDASALSFIFLNYFNYYLIIQTWHPIVHLYPFVIEIVYNGAKALQIDLGQIVLIVFLVRLYKIFRRPRFLSGSDRQ
ncbi:hypothetical protein DFR86_05230 [Acidianus sulfidivorans JP7]|uniref:Uncharacterized protein n=1 Tax=Acidianus sulfidivorans JP7 TaxID=619593 RepID=A0A2U9ILY0_9CREN|nr:hypothetical protein [Acidianus sulfidivorans]AWR97022.1 hypothetical protein DFR86_05230 [Acidianus sulfidivorans JP7]